MQFEKIVSIALIMILASCSSSKPTVNSKDFQIGI